LNAAFNKQNIGRTMSNEINKISGSQEQQDRIDAIQKQMVDSKTFDAHVLKRTVYYACKEKLYETLEKSVKENQFDTDLIRNAQEYSNLLATDYDSDKPYSNKNFLSDLSQSVDGLKTGFKKLDEYITIQQSTISFIAGRLGHGKTTMMINMMRNMIRDNPEHAFLFYSYEESHVDIMLKIILSCTDGKDKEIDSGVSDNASQSYFAKAKAYLKKYAVSIDTTRASTISNIDAPYFLTAYTEVSNWVKDERLQIMTRKPNIESLSGAIIERVQAVEMKYIDGDDCPQMDGKKVAAIFIDYVQKLNTEEDKVTRQQELQKICEDLLILSTDKRVEAALVMGAQVNRTANSLDTLMLESMREAGDIENIANIVIGVWDEEAGLTERAQELLSNEIQRKIKDEIKNKKLDIKAMKLKIIEMMQNAYNNQSEETSVSKKLTFKILKNRNGQNDRLCDATVTPERFCIMDGDGVDYSLTTQV
jgi:replicative DNA helicase